MVIAVVGATGMVGRVMLRVLQEQNIIPDELLVVASEQSVGKEIAFAGKKLKVQSLQSAVDRKPDIALFSAGGTISKEWAPKFAAQGCFVIDNSSAWRMDDNVPLVVPEINGDEISKETKIIANPNCSTIQMVIALRPLQHIYGIKRLVVSTYQSVTGSGVKGVKLETIKRLIP
jgi:aspartate-semialdehyde dehydrogenase